MRPDDVRKLGGTLAARGEIAYCVVPPDGSLRGRGGDRRAEGAKPMRLRSAKLLDTAFRFVSDCRICDRSHSGLRIALARTDHDRPCTGHQPGITRRPAYWSSPVPCNTNCLVAMSHAQDVPREHWFALNQVIRSRAIAMVAEKARVPVTQVTRLTVWGNNSENAYVDLQKRGSANVPRSR